MAKTASSETEKPKQETGEEKFAKQTPEQLEANRKTFLAKFGFGMAEQAEADEEKAEDEEKPEDEEKVDPEETTEGGDDKKEDKKEDNEEKKDDKKPDVKSDKKEKKKTDKKSEDDPPKGIVSDSPDLIDELEKETKSEKKETKKADLPLVEKTDEELSPKLKSRIEVLQKLEEMEPAKYRGIKEKTLEFISKENAYIEQWTKDNPGEEFDPEDTAHERFYDKNEPVVDDDDFEMARDEVREEKAARKAEEKLRPELEKERFTRQFEKALPKAHKESVESVYNFFEQAAPELAKLATDDKGILVLDDQTITKIAEEDPEAYEILNETGEKLRHCIREIHLIREFPGKYKIDPDKTIDLDSTEEEFRPHAEIMSFTNRLEKQLQEMPVEETTKDGKKFLRIKDLQSRFERIATAPLTDHQKEAAFKDLEKRYWCLDLPDIQQGLEADFADKAKKKIERLNSIVDKRLKARVGITGNNAPKDEKETEKPANNGRKANRPPNLNSSSDKTTTGGKGNDTKAETSKLIASKAFGIT